MRQLKTIRRYFCNLASQLSSYFYLNQSSLLVRWCLHNNESGPDLELLALLSVLCIRSLNILSKMPIAHCFKMFWTEARPSKNIDKEAIGQDGERRARIMGTNERAIWTNAERLLCSSVTPVIQFLKSSLCLSACISIYLRSGFMANLMAEEAYLITLQKDDDDYDDERSCTWLIDLWTGITVPL